jgi:hypothetical protein
MKREHKQQPSIFRTVTSVLAYPIFIDGKDDQYLAGIGLTAVNLTGLREISKVKLKGNRKLSGIRPTESVNGVGKPTRIEHKKSHGHWKYHAFRDSFNEVAALTSESCALLGEPRRKPKHLLILERSNNGALTEPCVEFEGEMGGTNGLSIMPRSCFSIGPSGVCNMPWQVGLRTVSGNARCTLPLPLRPAPDDGAPREAARSGAPSTFSAQLIDRSR